MARWNLLFTIFPSLTAGGNGGSLGGTRTPPGPLKKVNGLLSLLLLLLAVVVAAVIGRNFSYANSVLIYKTLAMLLFFEMGGGIWFLEVG